MFIFHYEKIIYLLQRCYKDSIKYSSIWVVFISRAKPEMTGHMLRSHADGDGSRYT